MSATRSYFEDSVFLLKALSFVMLYNIQGSPPEANVILVTTFSYTRKYLLCGYILGMLTHTTAWDRQWGGDETLK